MREDRLDGKGTEAAGSCWRQLAPCPAAAAPSPLEAPVWPVSAVFFQRGSRYLDNMKSLGLDAP